MQILFLIGPVEGGGAFENITGDGFVENTSYGVSCIMRAISAVCFALDICYR